MIDVANEKKFTLRIPDDLHEQLKLIADQDMRSLHSQILVILREGVEARTPEQRKRAALLASRARPAIPGTEE